MVAPDRVRSLDQIELFDIWIVFLRLTELLKIELFLQLTLCEQN